MMLSCIFWLKYVCKICLCVLCKYCVITLTVAKYTCSSSPTIRTLFLSKSFADVFRRTLWDGVKEDDS